MRFLKKSLVSSVAVLFAAAAMATVSPTTAQANANQIPAVDLTVAAQVSSDVSSNNIYLLPSGGGPAESLVKQYGATLAYNSKGDLAYPDSYGHVLVRPNNGGPTRIVMTDAGAYQLAYDQAGNLFAFYPGGGGQPTGVVTEAPADGSAQRVFRSGLSGDFNDFSIDANDTLYMSGVNNSGGAVLPANTTGYLMEIKTDGTQTVLDSTLSRPAGSIFDGAGNFYLADYGGGRVYKYSPSGTRTTIGNAGSPRAIALDQYGNVYVVESSYPTADIAEFPASGSGRIVLPGTYVEAYDIAIPPVPNTTLPSIGAGSDVYTTSYEGNDADLNAIDDLNFLPKGSNTASVVDRIHHNTSGLAVDGNGNYYTADVSSITKWAPDGTNLGLLVSDLPGRIQNMAIDNEGDLFINLLATDYSATSLVEELASGGAPITIAPGVVNDTYAVAVDSHDNVYRFDAFNQTITEYAESTFAPTVVESNAGFGSITVDSTGNIWTAAYTLGQGSSIAEYPAGGGAPIDFDLNWTTSFGTYDPSDRLIGYNVAVDSSDNVYVTASLLTTDDSYIQSDGVWQKSAGSSTFVQLDQSDADQAASSNGEEVLALAVPHGYSTSTVTGAPALISGTPRTARAGDAYNFQFSLGGTPAPTVSLTGGTLPTGLTLSSSGLLSGNTTAVGHYPVTITATNGVGHPASENVTVNVGAGDAAKITPIDGDNQSIQTNSDFAPFKVLVTDAYGNPISGQLIQFIDNENPHLAYFANPTSGGLQPDNEVVTGADGVATSSVLHSYGVAGGPVDVLANASNIAIPGDFANLSVISALTPPHVIGTPPAGAVGTPYSFQYTLTGSPLPTTSLIGGALPPGLSLSANGLISGIPTTAGRYNAYVAANNGTHLNDDEGAIITITPPNTTPATITGTPPPGVAGMPYSYALTVGGSPTPTLTVNRYQPLPHGLTLSADGVLSGTPVYASTYLLEITADNGTGTPVQLDFTLVIAPGAASQIQLSSGDQQSANTGSNFAQPLAVRVTDANGNSVPGQTVQFSDAETPAHVLFTTSTGTLAAATNSTTSAAGTATSSLVSAQNVAGNAAITASLVGVGSVPFTLHVTSPTVAPTVSGSYQSVAAGTAIDFQFPITGTPTPTVSITAGHLPPGLSLSSSGRLTGTSTAAGTYTYTVTAINSAGTTNHPVYTTVTPAAPVAITYVGGNSATAATGKAFANPLVVRVADVYGNPEPGISVQFADTETPHRALFGTSASAAVVTDANGLATAPVLTAQTSVGTVSVNASVSGVTSSFTFSETVVTAVTIATTPAPGPITAGVPYSYQLHATGTPAPTFSAPSLPSGLTLSPSGLLSGTTTLATNYSTNVTATNAYSSATAPFTLIVKPAAASQLTIINNPSLSALPGQALASPLAVQVNDAFGNGIPGRSVTFTESSNPHHAQFATGFSNTVNTSSGGTALSSTVTALSYGVSTITVSSPGLANVAYTLTVGTPTVLTVASPPSGVAGATYSYNFQATGTPAPTFSSNTAALPTGLTLSPSGLLSGIPTAAATYTFYVAASNAVSTTGRYVTITIAPGPATNISVVSGNAQSTLPNAGFTAPLTVLVTDNYGNPVSGVAVTFTVQSGPVVFGAASTTLTVHSGTDGKASGNMTAKATTGPGTITVTAPGITGPALFNESVVANKSTAANLQINLTGPTAAADGSLITGVISVKNIGPSAATNVSYSVTLPAGVTITNAGGGTINGNTITWTLASLASGATSSARTVQGRVGTNVHATSAVTAGVSSATYDPTPANNYISGTIKLG